MQLKQKTANGAATPKAAVGVGKQLPIPYHNRTVQERVLDHMRVAQWYWQRLSLHPEHKRAALAQLADAIALHDVISGDRNA